MDLSKLSSGAKLTAASGIALFVFSFFKWFEADVDTAVFTGQSDSAWGFTLGIVAVLLGLATAVLTLLAAFGVDLPPALTAPRTILILGSVTFLAVVLLVFTAQYETFGGGDIGTEKKIGAWLGLIAAIGLLAGVIMKFKESSGSAPSAPPAPPAA